MRKQSKPSNILNTSKGSLEEFKSYLDWDNVIKGLDYFNNPGSKSFIMSLKVGF